MSGARTIRPASAPPRRRAGATGRRRAAVSGGPPERPARFRDPGTWLHELSDEILVECPACSGLARSLQACRGDVFGPRRLVCSACPHRAERATGVVRVGAPREWFFGQPLFLTTRIGDHGLWALNLRHLDLLEQVEQ